MIDQTQTGPVPQTGPAPQTEASITGQPAAQAVGEREAMSALRSVMSRLQSVREEINRFEDWYNDFFPQLGRGE